MPDQVLSAGSGAAQAVARAGWLRTVTRNPVVRAAARRLALSVPLLLVVTGAIFVLLALIPGDPTETILGPRESSGIPEARYEELATRLGLDRPLYEQYGRWLWGVLQGDLGTSIITHQSVSGLIVQHAPVTISLTFGTLLVSLAVGVTLGMISAVRGGRLGRVVDVLAVGGLVIPVFWLAAELVVVFAVTLGWFPALGYVPFERSPSEWLRSLVLPVVALSLAPIGSFAKFTRESMLDSLASEYVRMARANGVSSASIVLRHAFKPAALPVVTLAGIWVVNLLIGAVFVEAVFSLPGIGSLLVDATYSKDLPVVQAIALVFTVIVIIVNLAVDLSYSLLSPKVSLE